MCVKVLFCIDSSPFDAVKEVLGDFVYIENLLSGESEEEVAA